MHIVFEHPHPLPVKRYGGTERILFWLMKELDRRGHRVSLIGHPETDVSGTRIQLLKRDSGSDWRSHIPKDAELVHVFATPPRDLPTPVIVTIEGNGQPGEQFHRNTVFISKNHADRHGAQTFVYNGIDLSEYPVSLPRARARQWNEFLFLAKAKWKVKNLRDCLRATRSARAKLHVAGGRAWSLSPRVRSYGMVDQLQKQRLFAQTDALLFPVRWHEPFGIAIIEAMAMGLPVIGSSFGSLPELIAPHTGVVCENFAQFQAALQNPGRSFDAQQIRAWVESRFTVTQMTDQYVRLYEQVVAGAWIQPTAPTTRDAEPAETLLTF